MFANYREVIIRAGRGGRKGTARTENREVRTYRRASGSRFAQSVLFTVFSTSRFTMIVSRIYFMRSLSANPNGERTGHDVSKLAGAEHGKQYTPFDTACGPTQGAM